MAASLFRSIGAVLAGYVVFASSVAALFAFSGQDPKVLPSLFFLLIASAWGALAAGIAGYTAAALSGRAPFMHAAALAALIGGIALLSLVLEASQGSIWSQASVLIVMVPVILFGGWLRSRASAGHLLTSDRS